MASHYFNSILISIPPTIINELISRLGIRDENLQVRTLGGGSINQVFHLQSGKEEFCCKLNSATKFPQLFQKEADGLEALAQTTTIRTPAVKDHFEMDGCQVLVLEWIKEGERTPVFWKRMGEQLAALHGRHSIEPGWSTDNYMGSVPQDNQPMKSWTDFFTKRRLKPMVNRCRQQGSLQPRHEAAFEKFYAKLPDLFPESGPCSLLHGDLWSGNFLCSENQEPVLIDPAVYFGHPAVDLGLTRLFGGFDPLFYEAYRYHALHPTTEEQDSVCNLYPLLIHLFLFGVSYRPALERSLQEFAGSF